MFQKNPTLKTHQPFALRVDGTKLQLSSALIPQTYIQDLSRGNPLTGELTILHSVAYDLRDPEERREISRLLVGLLRRLDAADFRISSSLHVKLLFVKYLTIGQCIIQCLI